MSMTSKRIGCEVVELVNYYDHVTVEKENTNVPFESKYIINLLLDNNVTIKFIVDKRYPFSPPNDISVNGKDYINIVSKSINKFVQIGVELDLPECFCCESYICPDKWIPSLGLVKLCQEIKDVIEKKQLIMHTWFCRIIASEKLTHDLPLENYL